MPVTPWTAEQVLGLAPDQSSVSAARAQLAPERWHELGASPAAVWGICQSGVPYHVTVELAGPAFWCSCPSRKVPCKHALGLLLMWSAGAVAEAPEPDRVREWLAHLAAKTAKVLDKPAERDDAAAARRLARRAERVAAGVAELDGWLTDQVRRGLGTLERGGSAAFAAVAARMVDAQAPGLAAGLRRAGEATGRGRDWPSRVLEELGALHLLVSAHARLESLPAGLADTVRSRLGYTVDTAEVAASGERVTDRWVVVGVVDQLDDRLSTRRVWLRGLDSGRPALVLSFAVPGQPLDGRFRTGAAVVATLAFYPGAQPLRVVVAEHGEACAASCPAGDSVATALSGYAAALAADPWLERWPVLLSAVTPAHVDDGWVLADSAGDALPLRAAADPWPLLAVSGGNPLTVGGEWSGAGLLPLSCWDAQRPVLL